MAVVAKDLALGEFGLPAILRPGPDVMCDFLGRIDMVNFEAPPRPALLTGAISLEPSLAAIPAPCFLIAALVVFAIALRRVTDLAGADTGPLPEAFPTLSGWVKIAC
jgi:hypothetical protein